MGLVDFWGIADLESTKWLKHKLRAMLGGQWFEQSDGRSWFPFPLRFALHRECFLIFRFSVRSIDYSVQLKVRVLIQ